MHIMYTCTLPLKGGEANYSVGVKAVRAVISVYSHVLSGEYRFGIMIIHVHTCTIALSQFSCHLKQPLPNLGGTC